MKLLVVNYKDNKDMVMLKLGDYDGKVVGIDSSKIDKETVDNIRANRDVIEKLALGERIKWLKEFIPRALAGYRSIYSGNIQVIREIEID